MYDSVMYTLYTVCTPVLMYTAEWNALHVSRSILCEYDIMVDLK